MLEIYRYVPGVLLKKPVEEMDIDTYLEYLAKARYLQEVERNIYAAAIAQVIGDEN